MPNLVERREYEGAYGMMQRVVVIDHEEHGRVMLVQGFGGVDSLRGGAYRWEHGVACQLRAGDTLDALHSMPDWNEGCSRWAAIVAGYDVQRPVFWWWTGWHIETLARKCGE